jgi:hypothetical protein
MTADEKTTIAKMGNPQSPANDCFPRIQGLAMAGMEAKNYQAVYVLNPEKLGSVEDGFRGNAGIRFSPYPTFN